MIKILVEIKRKNGPWIKYCSTKVHKDILEGFRARLAQQFNPVGVEFRITNR